MTFCLFKKVLLSLKFLAALLKNAKNHSIRTHFCRKHPEISKKYYFLIQILF